MSPLPLSDVGRSAAMVLITLALVGGCAEQDGGSGRAGAENGSGSATATPAGPVPVIDQDFPDPDVLHVDGTYFAYATQPMDGSSNVQLARSPDLRRWTVVDRDPLPELPAWATNGRTWAPEVTAVGDGYVMYLTARDIDSSLQCIGVARATDPAGPFRPVGRHPLVCPVDRGGAIDAATYVAPDGTRYLLWKNDGNCCGKPTWIHLQRLTSDGLRLAGPAHRLIRQDQAWEGNLVEAPTLVRQGSTYALFYSANYYGDASYATGYATADRLRGPYRKADQPLLSTDTVGVTGPGGQDVATGEDGRTYLVFHGWDPAVVYRGMYVRELRWADGRPVVGDPL